MIPPYKIIKQSLLILCISFLAACAGGGRPHLDKPASPNLVSQNDKEEEEYELIIIDPGFQSWFATNAQPIGFYSPFYYQNWNERYVIAWNEKVNQRLYYNHPNYPFENRIDYDPAIDYPVELNHQLYWYFRYIQALYGPLYNFPGFSLR